MRGFFGFASIAPYLSLTLFRARVFLPVHRCLCYLHSSIGSHRSINILLFGADPIASGCQSYGSIYWNVNSVRYLVLSHKTARIKVEFYTGKLLIEFLLCRSLGIMQRLWSLCPEYWQATVASGWFYTSFAPRHTA